MPEQLTTDWITVTEQNTPSPAGPRLRILSPVTVERYPKGTVVIGELENIGSADAINVEVQLTARNRNGAAVSSYTFYIETIGQGEKIVFEVRSFLRTSDSPSSLLYVTNADYSISYRGGGPDKGTFDIP